MKVIVDKEGKVVLENLCDLALKANGIRAYTIVKQIESVLQLEEEVKDEKKQSNDGRDHTKRKNI